MRFARRVIVAAGAWLSVTASPAAGQRYAASPAGLHVPVGMPVPVASQPGHDGVPGGRMAAQKPEARAPWWAPAASLLVPGTGQLLLGQQRSAAYAVTEAYLLIQALSARRDFAQERREYRDIAANVARKPFTPNPQVGPWEYYELLESGQESGAFDRIPGGVVDPETDVTTVNGARWLQARETYWRDPDVQPDPASPEYTRALAFYLERAVRDEFRWSWRDARDRQDVYRQTIAAANRSYRRSVRMMGLVGANHLASLIDAYITVRVRRYGGAGVAGLQLDGIETSVAPIGDPADGRAAMRSGLRLVPASRR